MHPWPVFEVFVDPEVFSDPRRSSRAVKRSRVLRWGEDVMKKTGKVVLFAALILFASSVLLALIPVRATAVEYTREGEPPMVVNCGSFPFRTKWSGDAGCDKARTRRIPQVMIMVLASGAVVSLGIVLYLGGRRFRGVTRIAHDAEECLAQDRGEPGRCEHAQDWDAVGACSSSPTTRGLGRQSWRPRHRRRVWRTAAATADCWCPLLAISSGRLNPASARWVRAEWRSWCNVHPLVETLSELCLNRYSARS